MGHGTASGRNATGAPQKQTLSEAERIDLRRAVTNREENADEARAKLREYNQRLRDDANTLDDIYASRADDETPEQTVARFAMFVGEERAVNTIATIINQNAWDGRIGRINRSWASEQTGALKESENRGVVNSRIHKAHLDQLASAIRRRQDERAFQSASRAASQRAREARQVGNNNFGSQVLRRNNRSR